MISIAIILAIGAAIYLLHKYWQNIVNWIKKAVEKIKEVLNVVVEGARTFICRTRDGLVNKSIQYNKNEKTKEFEETVFTRNVNESEVPPEILAKLRNISMDTYVETTEELEMALSA